MSERGQRDVKCRVQWAGSMKEVRKCKVADYNEVCSDLVTLTYLLILDENIKCPTDRGGDVVSDLSCSFPPGHSR